MDWTIELKEKKICFKTFNLWAIDYGIRIMWLTWNFIYGLVSFGSFHPPTHPWLVKQGRDEIEKRELGKRWCGFPEKREMDLVMLLGCWRWWGDKRWRIWDGGDGSGEKTSSCPVSWIQRLKLSPLLTLYKDSMSPHTSLMMHLIVNSKWK